MNEKKVNLFLAGAAKCGTTTLHHMLSGHPEIFAGPLKEPHFFALQHFMDAPRDFKKMITLTETAYRNNYKDASDERCLLDSSVHYLYFPDVPESIARYNNQAKIVIILRNPVDRIYSHYKMLYKKGQTKESFHDFLEHPVDNNGIDLLKLGLYSEGIERFYAVFPRNQILLLGFRQLLADDAALRSRLAEFLEIAPFDESVQTERENASSLPKNQFLRYLHMDFFLTRWLKQVIPKNPLRRRLGHLVQQRFYARRDMDETERAGLQQYYAAELERLKQFGVEL